MYPGCAVDRREVKKLDQKTVQDTDADLSNLEFNHWHRMPLAIAALPPPPQLKYSHATLVGNGRIGLAVDREMPLIKLLPDISLPIPIIISVA